MRLLKFIGAFLVTLVIVFFLAFGYNLQALRTLFKNSKDLKEGREWVSKTKSLKGLTQYIGANPERVSVVSRSLSNPDTTIRYSPDKPHTLGALSNFFLMTTYSRMAENGQINPDELVSLKNIDRYQLPYIKSSDHEDAKSWLDDQDVINAQNQVPLNELVQAMVTFNDLAIADYLYYKLGSESIHNTMDLMKLKKTDLPLPFGGLYITIKPKSQDVSFKKHFQALRRLSIEGFRDSVLTNERRFLSDKKFHDKMHNQFDDDQGLGIGFKERRDILALFPKSTAREMSGLMVRLQKDSLISKSVSGRIKNFMDWPFKQENLNTNFKYYGAMYDNRLGLLDGIDYGASSYTKEPFAQAVFFDSLQVAFWFHMSSSLMHQDYQQRLMWDPALRTATQNEISK